MFMPGKFQDRLKSSPVLCDGAMGTLLYSKGIFINRCYDELNVSEPELIRGIHQEYLHSGAEVIETNTFGANSFRLARHGFADKTHEMNLAGARLVKAPLSAMPNAGMPRSVEGRNIYLCSQEYMASYARKFVAAGVRFIGGCCGTTPEHIRAMKSAIRAGEAKKTTGPSVSKPEKA